MPHFLAMLLMPLIARVSAYFSCKILHGSKDSRIAKKPHPAANQCQKYFIKNSQNTMAYGREELLNSKHSTFNDKHYLRIN